MKSTKPLIVILFVIESLFVLPLIFAKTNPSKKIHGVGLILHDPTGISYKYKINNNQAFDIASGWSLLSERRLYFHATYLFTQQNYIKLDGEYLHAYWGIGGRFLQLDHPRKDEENFLGVRVPFGVFYEFRKVPIELFSEFALILDMTPSTALDVDFALGARYFF